MNRIARGCDHANRSCLNIKATDFVQQCSAVGLRLLWERTEQSEASKPQIHINNIEI